MAATKQAVLTGMGRCHNCGQELIEIDNRGERLNGCGALTDGPMGKACDMADTNRVSLHAYRGTNFP